MKTISQECASQLVASGETISPEDRSAAANRRLRDLVEYVKVRSPYFRTAYGNIPSGYTLTDLPVTTKSDLLARYDDWVTDPEVTESGVREYLGRLADTTELYLGRYTVLTTSGSSGAPMPMVRDDYHNKIHGALLSQRLLKDVSQDPLTTRAATVIATDGQVSSYSSALRTKRQLGPYADNFLILSIITPTAEIVDALNDFQPDLLTGYPSILMILAAEQAAGRLAISPSNIGSSAEKLPLSAYHTLRNTFGCPVLNNYCSTEGGEIAMSCPEGNLHVNDDWLLLEPVDDQLQPVPSGEWSSGVLITDLANYVQPIIRYHVDDCVRIENQPCACGSTLPTLEISGRMGDTISLNGVQVGFPVFASVFLGVEGLVSWQVVQTSDKSIEIRLVAGPGVDRSNVGSHVCEIVRRALQSFGCGEVEVTASDAPFIRNPRGGKTPYVVKQSV